ncbi:MAG: hypothetical protein ACRELC_04715, partial [Gemmatimonadota bacterium]
PGAAPAADHSRADGGGMEITEEYQQLVERTQATVEKFKERADELRGELGEARAQKKVQIKAMIDRLERKYDGAKARLAQLSGEDSIEALGELHQKVVSDLSDMKRTMERRIG